ncbi:hypothetical protein VB776_15805 [Arcicella sp. DC2W]|uniref:Uncharacterized protein n=1 Tax=Arcicella gelida TaxID=2984195 RepID=A0ABU5S7E0_9BACT|nr:hypothetical protein [Arcicella sp. DC2W]MEA5404398.1 hypothetical protein [Arcicella sp. DC2W]
MKTSIFHKISLYIWVLISFFCLSSLAQDSIPKPHKKALDKMLIAYQKELIRIIPILVKKPSIQKETTFISTFFTTDSVKIVNHLIPGMIKTDPNVDNLVSKSPLKASEFIKLIAGTYKMAFNYRLNSQSISLIRIDSLLLKKQKIYQYKQTVCLVLIGKPHERMDIEVNDTLNFITEIVEDSKLNILSTKISGINHKNTVSTVADTTNKELVIVNNNDIIDWSPEKKVKTFLGYLTILKDKNEKDSTSINKMILESNLIFDTSGYVNLTTKDGKNMRLTREKFLQQVLENKNSYEFNYAKISLYDNFRKSEFDKWFCRITTFHEVVQFEGENPVTNKVTSVSSMPANGDCLSTKGGYYQLAELGLKEL